MTKSKFLFFLFFLAAGYYLLTTDSYAQNAFGLAAIPPRLDISVKPGSAASATIKVRNESKVEKIITTSTKDIIVTDDKGTPQILDPSTATNNRWAASSWIQISPSQFKLKPNETKELSVVVIAPDNASPGGHYALINHSPNNQTMLSDTGSVINVNVGTLVYITVPGVISEDARISRFSFPFFSEFGPISFKTLIANYSDIHISPVGTIAITNWFGGRTANLELDQMNIFPGASREFTSTLSKRWLFGRYQAQLLASYGTSGQLLKATGFFWVIPIRLIICLVLIIVIAIALVYLLKKHRQLKKYVSKPESPELSKLQKKTRD